MKEEHKEYVLSMLKEIVELIENDSLLIDRADISARRNIHDGKIIMGKHFTYKIGEIVDFEFSLIGSK